MHLAHHELGRLSKTADSLKQVCVAVQDQASKDSRAAEQGEGTSDPKSKPLVPVMDHLPPRFHSVSLGLFHCSGFV